MKHKDKLSAHYKDVLDGTYDCIDRLVLNGYYSMGYSPGGFRTWFRDLKGSDENLNNNTLMGMVGRFSSRAKLSVRKTTYHLFISKRGNASMKKQRE